MNQPATIRIVQLIFDNIKCWHYIENSSRRVSEIFSVKFPDRPIRGKTTIQNIVYKFKTKGTVSVNAKIFTAR